MLAVIIIGCSLDFKSGLALIDDPGTADFFGPLAMIFFSNLDLVLGKIKCSEPVIFENQV